MVLVKFSYPTSKKAPFTVAAAVLGVSSRMAQNSLIAGPFGALRNVTMGCTV